VALVELFLLAKFVGRDNSINFLTLNLYRMKKQNELIINLDVDPYLPDGWKIEQHLKQGQLKLNSEEIYIYLSEKSTNAVIQGRFLEKESIGRNGLNANVLDYLLDHTELIPQESLKGRDVYFWGTIYRNHENYLFVRVLARYGKRWIWRGEFIAKDWSMEVPARFYTNNFSPNR